MPAPDYATEISQLEAALASGEATIESDGDRLTYRSVREIKDGLTYFRQKAADASAATAVPSVTVAGFSRF